MSIKQIKRLASKKFIFSKKLTLRQEANAITCYAFRNGFLEDLHSGNDLPKKYQLQKYSKINDKEMKKLMKESSEKVADLLYFKKEQPIAYSNFIRYFYDRFCSHWKK